MQVAVWDTYVKKKNGSVIHFDIIVPEDLKNKERIFIYGKQFTTSIGEMNAKLDAEECQYCHIEQPSDEIVNSINENGYYILEMEEIPKNLPKNPTRREMVLFLKAHYKEYRFANFKGMSEGEVRGKLEKSEALTRPFRK